jgi:hypothetical protein
VLGSFPFDPMGMRSEDTKLKELKNGRLAMLAFIGFCSQAAVRGMGPVDCLKQHIEDPWNNNSEWCLGEGGGGEGGGGEPVQCPAWAQSTASSSTSRTHGTTTVSGGWGCVDTVLTQWVCSGREGCYALWGSGLANLEHARPLVAHIMACYDLFVAARSSRRLQMPHMTYSQHACDLSLCPCPPLPCPPQSSPALLARRPPLLLPCCASGPSSSRYAVTCSTLS